MCFSGLFGGDATPQQIVQPRLPDPPTQDEDAIRERQRREEEILQARAGTQGSVRSEFSPPAAQSSQRRVLLGV